MRRIHVYIPGVIIPFSLVINNSIILTRIYYKINYKGTIQNFETIIEKSELFDYEKYCKFRDYKGNVPNISIGEYPYYIDREYIESLKQQIEHDKNKFHFYPFFTHDFTYSLEATNESLIYLKYNNGAIIKAENENQTEIFSARRSHYDNGASFWQGNWFLNFTQIPFAPTSPSTIMLNNTILVKMYLRHHYDYNLGGSTGVLSEQFLCFNSNFHIMFVYIPPVAVAVA
ncbi:MAG: hypothetical protein ACW980_14450 [Promethearchaeota archaeon]|jgi:hypothetical protein